MGVNKMSRLTLHHQHHVVYFAQQNTEVSLSTLTNNLNCCEHCAKERELCYNTITKYENTYRYFDIWYFDEILARCHTLTQRHSVAVPRFHVVDFEMHTYVFPTDQYIVYSMIGINKSINPLNKKLFKYYVWWVVFDVALVTSFDTEARKLTAIQV